MIFEDFKQYCRDKGKYNVTSLPDMVKLFNEFEKRRIGANSTEEIIPEAKEIDFSSILGHEENQGKE